MIIQTQDELASTTLFRLITAVHNRIHQPRGLLQSRYQRTLPRVLLQKRSEKNGNGGTGSQRHGRHRTREPRRLFRRFPGRPSGAGTDQDGIVCGGLSQDVRKLSSILHGRISPARTAHWIQEFDLSSGHQGICPAGWGFCQPRWHGETQYLRFILSRRKLFSQTQRSRALVHGQQRPKYEWMPVLYHVRRGSASRWKAHRLWPSPR